jgi:hypothetical protein
MALSSGVTAAEKGGSVPPMKMVDRRFIVEPVRRTAKGELAHTSRR